MAGRIKDAELERAVRQGHYRFTGYGEQCGKAIPNFTAPCNRLINHAPPCLHIATTAAFAPIGETCGCDESKALRAERDRLLNDLVDAHRTIAKLK